MVKSGSSICGSREPWSSQNDREVTDEPECTFPLLGYVGIVAVRCDPGLQGSGQKPPIASRPASALLQLCFHRTISPSTLNLCCNWDLKFCLYLI